ncbi:putative sugar transporter family protein [Podospora australis]|uniref:Sugar transporter family protein n=1 Tax=Podospora australis TaxID=1536484 RepID=A0AAN6WMQ0_9PEZI|nr:putative sugar transporter family protein [Podospora australis]
MGDRDRIAPRHGISASRYLATRFDSLKPPLRSVTNPFRLLRMLNRTQWAFFLVAFLPGSVNRNLHYMGRVRFFTVSLTVSELAASFDKTKTDITWGITLMLMFRSIGSVLFGIALDRYGRKWPFIVNNILFIALESGTGFCNSYGQFLACRALFDVAMGGLYSNAVATALEDLPEEARGLMSGLLQQGCAFGYLLATAFARAFVGTTPHDRRPLFWFGVFPPVLIIIFRLMLPETKSYQQQKEQHALTDTNGGSVSKNFLREGKEVIKHHWLLLVYLVSYGWIQLHPTMLEVQFEFSRNQITVIQVLANLDGGSVLSPNAFRTFIVGTSYQLGNLVSSASSTIESIIGEQFPLLSQGTVSRFEFGKVICIFTSCSYVYVFGPEHLGRKFETVEEDSSVGSIMYDDGESVITGRNREKAIATPRDEAHQAPNRLSAKKDAEKAIA